jgi:23S rRNA (guanosine2251-2'-O)-methyltransferase
LSPGNPGGPEASGRLVLGLQPVRELLRRHGTKVHEVLVQAGDSPRLEALARYAQDQGALCRRVTGAELDRLSRGTRHQGVAAFGPALSFTPLDELLARPDLLALALDGIVDPQNFGATVRSAVGLTEAPLMWAENGSAPLTPSTFRASAGAIEHAVLCRVRSLHGALSEAAFQGIQVIGLDPAAPTPLDDLHLENPTILVIGSEEKGMGRATRKSCTALGRLTNSTRIQSLNASVAAALALYTAVLHRRRAAGLHPEPATFESDVSTE